MLNTVTILYLLCGIVSLCRADDDAQKVGSTVVDVFIPSNRKDDQYYNVNVDFNGQTLPLLLDTGSGDILVASNKCPNKRVKSGCFRSKQYQITNSTVILKNETFGTVVGVGGVSGDQSIMPVQFGSFNVEDLATPLISKADVNEFQNGSFSGILGVSPRNVSREYFFFQRLPPIDAMIAKGLFKKPLFSLSLPRYADPTSPKTGKLTLGAIEQKNLTSSITYADIIDAPNYNYPGSPLAPQSWTAELQSVRVNGKEIILSKGVIDHAGRYMSLFDSGAQKIHLRRADFDKVSKLIKGKVIRQPGQDFYFDCSVPQLIELKYHGQWFPVDPLDLIIPGDHGLVNGTQMCHAAMATWDRSFADSIIGVPFLRNVLSVFDYKTKALYTQQPQFGLASTTDAGKSVARYASLYKSRMG